jgi:hypothetical protein
MSEWKPGDVAMVNNHTNRAEPWKIALCVAGGPTGVARFMLDNGGPVWSSVDGARPLVVIDPEDREQVERLARLFRDHLLTTDDLYPGLAKSSDSLAVALREFADLKPPCTASLTLGKDGALYRCTEAWGHAGPHVDGTCRWTAKS